MKKLVLVGLLIIFAVMLFGTEEQRVYAFLGTTPFPQSGRGSVYIVDVTDPASPEEVFSMKTNYWLVGGVHASGNYVFFTSSNPAAWLTGHSELLVIDISDIENPKHVASIELPDSANSIAEKDNYLFISNWDSGVSIVDISDPEIPVLVKTIPIRDYPLEAGVRDVKVYKDYLYLAAMDHKNGSRSGIHILDISDPENPQALGSNLGFQRYGEGAFAVALAGDRLFVSTIAPYFQGGLEEVDVSNPSSPKYVGKIIKNCNAFGLVIDAGYVYVGTTSTRGSLTYFLVEDETAVKYLRTGGTHGQWGWQLFTYQNKLYGAFANDGLMVFDISTPGVPVRIGQFKTPQSCQVVRVIAR